MRKNKIQLINRKGSALTMVLVVLVVFSILSISLINVAQADLKHSIHTEHHQQAHYMARSGAESFAVELIRMASSLDYSQMDTLLNQLDGQVSNMVTIGDDYYDLEVTIIFEDGQEKLSITATGYVGNVNQIATVVLGVHRNSQPNDFNASNSQKALVALSDAPNSLVFSGSGYVEGDVFVNATLPGAIDFNGWGQYIRNGILYLPNGVNPHEVIKTDVGANVSTLPSAYAGFPNKSDHNSGYIQRWAFWQNVDEPAGGVRFTNDLYTYPSVNLPQPQFPSFPPYPEGVSLTHFETPYVVGEQYIIDSDGVYLSLSPSGSRIIKIDMNYGDRTLRVQNLNLTGGHIELINTAPDSRLYLYVDESLNFGSDRRFNHGGNPDHVQIYFGGTQTLVIDGAARFSGNIFVKEADVHLTAGSNFRGNLVSLGDYIRLSGNAQSGVTTVYAPNAHLYREGSARINGAVIVNRMTLTGGGTTLAYHSGTYDIPSDFFESGVATLQLLYDDVPWRR